MGYTHHDKVCGVNGLYTGDYGSEVRMDEKQGLVVFTCAEDSGAQVVTATVPISGTVVAAYGSLSVADINCDHTVTHGSAGDEIATVTSASPGVSGVALTLALSSTASYLTVTAGEVLVCNRSTTTTAGASSCTIVVSKTA